MTAYQLTAVSKARYPAIRAIEALAMTVPLFLLLFAANYFLMAQADLGNFNVDSLTRTDALYFTVTVFATVGFGDITATSQAARVVVTAQMILDLFVLGLLGSVYFSARSSVAANNTQRSRRQNRLERITGAGISGRDRASMSPQRAPTFAPPVPRRRAAATWGLARC